MEAKQILLRSGTVLQHQDDDTVMCMPATDILVEDDLIAAIGPNLTCSDNAEIIDCSNRILSPGFIDTHHHLWQTQLKGRHADESHLEYMTSGNMQCYNFTPQDICCGQLSGCLEALDCGTTTVLDYSHGCYTLEHAQQAMAATLASGVRCVLALAPVMRMEKWDSSCCVPTKGETEWVLQLIESWAIEAGANGIQGRVYPAFAFDAYFLPKPVVQNLWSRVQTAGAKLVTSHVARNGLYGQQSKVQLLNDYGLLKHPQQGGIRWLVSHGNNIFPEDIELLRKNDVYISTTPETEAQMGHGCAMALSDGIEKACLGVDCHSNNSSSMLDNARTLLWLKRQETNERVLGDKKDGAPRKIRGTTTELFNLITIQGARALGMEDQIGTLAVGKKADIVVFDAESSVGMLCAAEYDPLVAVVRHSDARDIEMVIVDGVIRKAGGKLLDVEVRGGKVSWKDVARKTRVSQVEVQKRIDGCNRQHAEEVLIKGWGVDRAKLADT